MIPYISIVVPVYKVEEYIEECVDSILGQSFQSFELILVDDGSPDNCPKICDSILKRDNRVKVIHKINGGLSDARNYGTDIAIGKYILYVDSDDYIKKDSLDKIVRACKEQNEPDVLFLQAKKVYPDNIIKEFDIPMNLECINGTKLDTWHYISNRAMFPASAWSKMVKREVLEKNHIRFKVGQLSEDYEWSLKLYLSVESFGAYNGEYYYYRQNRRGSITNNLSEKHFIDLLDIIDDFKGIAMEHSENEAAIFSFAAYIYRTLLWNAKPFYKKYRKRICDNRFLLTKRNCKDIKLIHMSSSFLGIGITIRLLGIYRSFKR